MNSMNDGLLYADKSTHGRARLSRALLTLAIPPLACGFVIGLSWGAAGMTVAFAALAAVVPQVENGGATGALPILVVAFVLLYQLCFSFSWGPLAGVIPQEILPYRFRAKVMAIGNLGNFAAAAAIQSTFPSLKDKAGYSWAFGLYAALNAAFFAFAFICVPETKGKELEAAGESVRASRTEEIAPDAADATVQA